MKSNLGKASVLALLAVLVLVSGVVAHASPAVRPPAQSGFYYTVRWGDTLYSIARRFGTTVAAIAQANGILNPAYIRVGQVLFIPAWPAWPPPPPTGFYYTVRPGDTLYSIARRFGTTHWAIAAANHLPNPNCIYAGQRLFIPGYVPPPPVPTAVPTAIPTAIPTATPTPTPQVAVCPPGANITYPTVNAKLDGWGTTFIKGTAAIPNFWYYKLEFGWGEKPIEWHLIKELHYQPVVRGILGYWNTGALPEGVYILRLVVVDNTGNYPQPCQVRVIIDR